MHYRRNPPRDPPFCLMVLAFIALTVFYAWLDRMDREYTAELAAEAVLRRLQGRGA
jgi:hypothetical protein